MYQPKQEVYDPFVLKSNQMNNKQVVLGRINPDQTFVTEFKNSIGIDEQTYRKITEEFKNKFTAYQNRVKSAHQLMDIGILTFIIVPVSLGFDYSGLKKLNTSISDLIDGIKEYQQFLEENKIELPNGGKVVIGLNHSKLKETYANPGRRNRFLYCQEVILAIEY